MTHSASSQPHYLGCIAFSKSTHQGLGSRLARALLEGRSDSSHSRGGSESRPRINEIYRMNLVLKRRELNCHQNPSSWAPFQSDFATYRQALTRLHWILCRSRLSDWLVLLNSSASACLLGKGPIIPTGTSPTVISLFPMRFAFLLFFVSFVCCHTRRPKD